MYATFRSFARNSLLSAAIGISARRNGRAGSPSRSVYNAAVNWVVHPDRFELPTYWFVVVLRAFRLIAPLRALLDLRVPSVLISPLFPPVSRWVAVKMAIKNLGPRG